MNSPVIQANESLVQNGDFEQGFSNWKKGPTNPDWLGTASEIYEGVPTRFLKAGNESSVSQSLEVPKDPGAQARYVLSFLCETRHTESGKLVVSIDGQTEELEILLPPGEPRDAEEDQARLKNGQPLDFKPISYETDLALPFNGQDTIIISVFSPSNEAGDYTSQVCITRIKLHLHLDPAVMQTLKLDEQSLSTTEPLHVCLGASASKAHQLEFVPEPDSIWLGTQAALTCDDNPLDAVVAMPVWGEDQPVESPWTLDCPLIGDQDPYLFSMNLINQYTAAPYPVQVSLGHHRLIFREVLEAAYYPVLEYGQSVRLGVQVASYYTDQPLSGRTVNWTSAQGVSGVGVSDENGWAYFDYQPMEAGEFDIEASVESPYYAAGVVTQTLQVWVLEADPWKDVLAVVGSAEARWEEKTGYPNRGSDYPVNLKLPANSPLIGTELSLHWSGDSHEQLGVVVSPPLETSVPVINDHPAWMLTSADELDGRFYLELVCSKLLLSSPKKTMSLARNLVKIGEVREANKFPVVDENESALLRIQVLHLVASGDGDPVVNALVEWQTPEGPVYCATTGTSGWASFLYTPTSDGDKVVTASIKAHAEAVAVDRPFNVKAIATSPWKSQVKILLDGAEVERNTLGVLCERGQTHTLKVEPVPGSDWVGKNISLHWRGTAPDIGLVPSDLTILKPIVTAGVEWTLASQADNSTSSLFELELRIQGEPVRELSGRLMAADLSEEVSVRLDQIAAALDTQALYPCLGARHRFSVLPNALSPLAGLDLSLTWSGTPAEQLGATVQPALDQALPINDGGAIWTLDFTASQQPGQFALALALPQMGFTATAKPMILAHNKVRIEAKRESPVDPVVGQDPAWLWVQVFSHFTELAVDGVAVNWSAADSSVVPTNAEGWSGFAFAPTDDQPHEVQASVTSLYDGYSDTRSMTVTALASDPWAGLMVKFDGAPAQPWGEKTYFPRRKGEHTFELLAAENSPLFDRDLTLGMTGTGPTALGIKFLPEALGVARSFDDEGLRYTFKADDLKDGSFALRLSSERLASLSPANAMSLGEGSQVMKINWDNLVSQTLDWGKEINGQVTVISTISGKAMANVTVTWSSPDLGVVTSVTNYYGVAKLRFVPTTPGDGQLNATVGDGESVALSYFLNEPREIEALTSPKQSGEELERVSASVTVVSALTGKPLPDIEVKWEYPDRNIAPTRTDAEGIARVEFRLSGVRRALLEAVVTGGYAGWEVQALEFETILTDSAPTSSTWNLHFRPYIDGERVKWNEVTLRLFDGETRVFKLDYEYSTLIGDPEALLALYAKDTDGVVFDPQLGTYHPMAEGTTSMSWTVSSQQASSGPFELQFKFPVDSSLPSSPLVPGEIINLVQDVEVKLDELPVTFEKDVTAYPCHGATHTVTVKPKPSSSMLNKPVKLVWKGETAESLGVVVTPSLDEEQLLTLEGVTWVLDCTNTTSNGDFSLQLMLVETGRVSPPLAMSLGHNLVRADHWITGPHYEGWPEWTEYYRSHIRAISVHLNSLASNVKVTIGNGSQGLTNSKGEYESRYSLKIINQYDQSIV
ncbi:hypothetical protein [Pseudomonas sp. A-RE-19]|uniref:hypothetical protein n=1 Tax=Pseudomonas sp. A-RE-19 TaxID=2832401 RepID=UPI001CBC5FBC|nr:hypothetical protein [Pseudomonas sp. A-RE-19]